MEIIEQIDKARKEFWKKNGRPPTVIIICVSLLMPLRKLFHGDSGECPTEIYGMKIIAVDVNNEKWHGKFEVLCEAV